MRYSRLLVDGVEYDRIISNLISNNQTFTEYHFGSTKKIGVRKQIMAIKDGEQQHSLNIGKISNKELALFLAQFNKELYRNLYRIGIENIKEIEFNGMSRSKNNQKFKELLVGNFFYCVDIKSAYWQIARRLGYISQKLFDEYFVFDEYKQAKRYCISFLAREKSVKIYHEGKTIQIYCDRYEPIFNTESLNRLIYNNIRYELYNLISNAATVINGKTIETNIDGITVTKHELDTVKKFFKEEGIQIKIFMCRKINDKQYLKGGKIINFIK